LGRQFAERLVRGIKQVGMYRHNEGRFPEFLRPAYEVMAAATDEFSVFRMTVEAQNFSVAGMPLLQESSTLPFRFYRDGIRQIHFNRGFTIEELVGFTMIALSDPEKGADDAVAQLWQADLPHVEYVAAEGFAVEGSSEQEVEVQVEEVVSYLYSRLRSHSDDYLRFARVSAADLDTKFDGIEQIRGVVVTASPAQEALKAKLQREIAEEEHHRLFPKLVSAVFQVMESGLRDVDLLLEVLTQLLDALLLQEDFSTIQQMVIKLSALEKSDDTGSFGRLRSLFVSKMGEEQRVSRVADLLRAGRPQLPPDLRNYLSTLEARAVPPLLAVLETVESPENRILLCDILAAFASANFEPFLVRLQSERPQTVRDMLYVLDKAQYPERGKLFQSVVFHPNLAMRLEVMQMIAKSATHDGRMLMVKLLNDPVGQVRMQAARLLYQMGPDDAFLDLIRLVRTPGFEKRPFDERGAIYMGLGSTNSTAAVAMLNELLNTKPTLLTRRRVMEDKLLAIQGLIGAKSISAYQTLQRVGDDTSQGTEIQTAARRGAAWIRRALFNSENPDGAAGADS
jgi:hypothetical protein